jgi:hypothetical protein
MQCAAHRRSKADAFHRYEARLNLSGTKDSGSGRKPAMVWRLPRFFFDSSTPKALRHLRNCNVLLEEKDLP